MAAHESALQTCPDPDLLVRLSGNDLPRDRAAGVEHHLSNCRPCLDRVLAAGQRPSFPRIDSLHLVAELGRGRFGIVYKAWWLRDKPRLAALKVLTEAGEAEQRRFEREAAVLERLDSPGIVKCLHHGTIDGRPYYVMDFVEGEHLDEYLAYRTKSLAERLAVFARVCRVVAAAHGAGVVHRDLKPKNILIDAAGEAHVLDFGICSLGPADWSSSLRRTITHVGDLIGTLKYMSPEQAWGGASGPVDHRSDLWALGIMLYEIVTDGLYPYELGPTAEKSAHEALLDRIRRQMPRRARLRHIPRGRDLETLLERTLSWDIRHRLNSAAALADDIERHLRGERIRIRPPSLVLRLRRLAVGAAVRTRRAALLASVTLAVAAVYLATRLLDVRWQEPPLIAEANESIAPVTPLADARESVLLVGISDASPSAVTAFARRQGWSWVTDDVRTWRVVHGRLMTGLAETAPLALLWDYYFETPQEGDEALADGTNRLVTAGVPVIFAATTYDEVGNPLLSPTLLQHLDRPPRHGSIVARDMVHREGQFILASRRTNGTIVPHAALVTYAALREPTCMLEIDWKDRSRRLELVYRAGTELYLRHRDVLELEIPIATRRAKNEVLAGDLVAYSAFPLSGPAFWSERTVPYEELLTLDRDRLATLVRARVLLVADLRAARPGFLPDRHAVVLNGTLLPDVPGGMLLADLVSGLLGRPALRQAFPLPWKSLGWIVGAAALGCVGAILLARSAHSRRMVLRRACGSFAAVLVVAGLLLATNIPVHASVQIGLAAASLGMSLLTCLGVELARNRHRLTITGSELETRALAAAADTLSLNRPPTTTPPSCP